jgi:hypothetical protein
MCWYTTSQCTFHTTYYNNYQLYSDIEPEYFVSLLCCCCPVKQRLFCIHFEHVTTQNFCLNDTSGISKSQVLAADILKLLIGDWWGLKYTKIIMPIPVYIKFVQFVYVLLNNVDCKQHIVTWWLGTRFCSRAASRMKQIVPFCASTHLCQPSISVTLLQGWSVHVNRVSPANTLKNKKMKRRTFV